jgi:hypothetical protein
LRTSRVPRLPRSAFSVCPPLSSSSTSFLISWTRLSSNGRAETPGERRLR